MRRGQAFAGGMRLMMIDKRIRFTKTEEAKYISHLDLYRFMLRALKRAKLPVWHTEGFNPHVYVTFALPLSLGQCGECEVMDFRLTKPVENFTVLSRLNETLPPNIRVTAVYEPIHSPKEITSARYEITLGGSGEYVGKIEEFLYEDSITVEKKTKKGVSQIDIAPHIKDAQVKADENDAVITVTLPAGNQLTVNPVLLTGALFEYLTVSFEPVDITRKEIFISDGRLFD